MLVHKGGQINNVKLITGLRIAEMSQLQNCSVKCTKNGSYCENVKKGGGGGGQGTRVIQELMTMKSFLRKYYYTQFYLLCHTRNHI